MVKYMYVRKVSKGLKNSGYFQSTIFFDMFYGEEWIVKGGQTWSFTNEEKPLGCLVWSGSGVLNKIPLAKMQEYLITPKAKVELCAHQELCIYVFYPIPE